MTSNTPSRGKTIAVWALKIVVALLFVATGMMKLSGQPMAIDEFNQIGLGQGFRYITGVTEVVSALLLLVPATSAIGAVLLFCVSTGALLAQAFSLHQDIIHTLILMAITGLLIWLSRAKLKSLTGAV